jgi:hypothetical protein
MWMHKPAACLHRPKIQGLLRKSRHRAQTERIVLASSRNAIAFRGMRMTKAAALNYSLIPSTFISAGMAELADAADSKSAGTWYLGGSIPPPGTILNLFIHRLAGQDSPNHFRISSCITCGNSVRTLSEENLLREKAVPSRSR